MAAATGASTVLLWRSGYPWFALLALFLHGNICCCFNAGIHELMHGTVFRSGWLNTAFLRLFEVLYWVDASDLWARHQQHHRTPLHPLDPERDGNCRPTWAGTWLWAFSFNLPRFLSVILGEPRPYLFFQAVSLAVFAVSGYPELIVVVNFAPFLFGVLQAFCQMTQHVGNPTDPPQRNQWGNSVRLPWLLSVVNWRIEYHLAHHLNAGIPCYHLAAFSSAAGYPPPMSVRVALAELRREKKFGECGHGVNPLERILAGESVRSVVDAPGREP
jgi:fatty acid desaturase